MFPTPDAPPPTVGLLSHKPLTHENACTTPDGTSGLSPGYLKRAQNTQWPTVEQLA